MKLIQGLFCFFISFNLMANEAQIIGKYACYKIKSYKKAHECYTRMMAEHPEIQHPWVVKNFKKKTTSSPKENKISPPSPTISQTSYQQVLNKWQNKKCPISIPLLRQPALDEKDRIEKLNEQCQEWETNETMGFIMHQSAILKKLDDKNCPRSAEVYRAKDKSYFRKEEMDKIEKIADSLCQSEHHKIVFLNELNQKPCPDTAKIFEERIVWLKKDSSESQYWEKECQLELGKINDSKPNVVDKKPLIPPPSRSKNQGKKK